MVIDIYTHIFPEEFVKELRKKYKMHVPRMIRDSNRKLRMLINGKRHGPWPWMDILYDPKKRIKDMDREGVDLQVLSVVPFTLVYEEDPEFGIALARAQNDAIAEVVRTYPERFVGAATAPLQDVDGAIEELDRAVKELGMKGVEIGSNVRGKNLASFELWPFYEKVQELDVPMIVHPINHAGAERMQRYYLTNLIGNPLETALAIASIIFGGVLERFPKLKFCFVHAGGFLPYQTGRLEHGYEERPEPKVAISKPPSEYLKSLYFDTITHFQPALLYLISTMGSSRVLLGSDFPYDMGDPHPVSTIQKIKSLPAEDKERIMGENASKLFKIGL